MHTSVLWSWEKGRGRNARIDLSSGLPQVAKALQRFQGCSQSCVLAILSSQQTLHDVAAGLFFPFPSLQMARAWAASSSYVLLPLKSKLPRNTRKSRSGRKTFSGSSSLSSIPPAPQFLPCHVYGSRTSPRLQSSAEGLQSPTSAPPPAPSSSAVCGAPHCMHSLPFLVVICVCPW